MSKVARTPTFAADIEPRPPIFRPFGLARFWCLVLVVVVPSEAVLRNIVWGG